MDFSKWLAPVALIWAPAAALAANYQLVNPYPIVCEGILVSHNGLYSFVADDSHLNSNSDNDFVCSLATIAEKSTNFSPKYTLKDKEVERILKTCSVGKLCRIEGYMSGLTHDVYFFVKIDSVSAE